MSPSLAALIASQAASVASSAARRGSARTVTQLLARGVITSQPDKSAGSDHQRAIPHIFSMPSSPENASDSDLECGGSSTCRARNQGICLKTDLEPVNWPRLQSAQRLRQDLACKRRGLAAWFGPGCQGLPILAVKSRAPGCGCADHAAVACIISNSTYIVE